MRNIHVPEIPLTWWLTGLPAAGKTTLAVGLQSRYVDAGKAFVVLDGDRLREGLCSDLGFSPEDRAENIRRVAEVARVVNDSGVSVAVALVSPFKEARATARQIIGTQHFIESHVCANLEVCVARDPKGLYARARHDPSFPLTGLNAPYEPPDSPEVVAFTAEQSILETIDELLAAAQRKVQEIGNE